MMADSNAQMASQIGALPAMNQQDYASMIAEIQAQLANGNLSSVQTTALTDAMRSFQVQAATAAPGDGSSYLSRTLQADNAGSAQSDAGAALANSATGDPISSAVQQAGTATAQEKAANPDSGWLAYLKARIGDAGLVMLGIIVIAIALFASVELQGMVKQ